MVDVMVSETSFQFFPGGGQNFDRRLRVEGKILKNKILCSKTQKLTIFSNSGGGGKFPSGPPPNDVPAWFNFNNNNFIL